jgi:hypothetical protein
MSSGGKESKRLDIGFFLRPLLFLLAITYVSVVCRIASVCMLYLALLVLYTRACLAV